MTCKKEIKREKHLNSLSLGNSILKLLKYNVINMI